MTATLPCSTGMQVLGDPMCEVPCVLGERNREGTELLSNIVQRDASFRDYDAATGFVIDEAARRLYNALHAMQSVATLMSASGLYADGRSNDIRLARNAWSIPVVQERAAKRIREAGPTSG